MSWMVFVYCENDILETVLEIGQTVTVGSGNANSIRIEQRGLDSAQVSLTGIDTGVQLSSNSGISFADDIITNQAMSAGDIVRVASNVSITFFQKRCELNQAVVLSGNTEITIGRSSLSGISLLVYRVL